MSRFSEKFFSGAGSVPEEPNQPKQGLRQSRIIKKSFGILYPDKEFVFDAKIKFSGKFRPYNANIKKKGDNLQINLSKTWRGVSEEILVGLIQDLLYKIFREKDRKTTTNIDLYNKFIKSLHLAAPKTRTDSILENSFIKVNDKYFFGLLEKPNLVFGNSSKRTLASYDFHTDTITVSSLFRSHENIIDYLIYHELLHKKLKYKNKSGKNFHHTSEFKTKEKAFENQQLVEKKIREILKSKTLKYKLLLSGFRI